MRLQFRLFLAVLMLIAPASVAVAELRLSNTFTDHMVLQQQMPIRVWGWAEPGERVTLQFAGRTASANADSDGKWLAELPAMKADGESHTLTVKAGGKSVRHKDVLLGEVWICSGQSNMEWAMRYTAGRVTQSGPLPVLVRRGE